MKDINQKKDLEYYSIFSTIIDDFINAMIVASKGFIDIYFDEKGDKND